MIPAENASLRITLSTCLRGAEPLGPRRAYTATIETTMRAYRNPRLRTVQQLSAHRVNRHACLQFYTDEYDRRGCTDFVVYMCDLKK
jgi:hypothetical protein